MRKFADNVWVAEAKQGFMGVEVGTRMTVIRLPDGALFIHSPIRLTDELKTNLLKVGSPRYVVAPNCFHHLYIGDYPEAFKDMKVYVAPGLKEKRPDLQSAETLELGRSYPWSSEIDHKFCQGMPKVNEVTFFHKASRTVLISDLAFHFNHESALSAKIFALMTGIYNRLGFSWLDRKLFIRDDQAAKDSFAEILKWDFDKLILAHGQLVDRDAHTRLKKALPSH